MFLVINNGKINLWKGNSQFLLTPKPSITMIIGMLGIELFSIIQKLIPGFSIFMTIAQLFSISFYHWWTWFGCSPNFLRHDAKEVWDFWVKNTITMEPYMREVQFFRQFNIAWIFC